MRIVLVLVVVLVSGCTLHVGNVAHHDEAAQQQRDAMVQAIQNLDRDAQMVKNRLSELEKKATSTSTTPNTTTSTQ